MRLISAAAILALGLVVSALIVAHPATPTVEPYWGGHVVEDPIVVTVEEPGDVYIQPLP